MARPAMTGAGRRVWGEWASGRVGEWASGRVGEWASGRVGEWASGRVGEWASGRVAEWPSGAGPGADGLARREPSFRLRGQRSVLYDNPHTLRCQRRPLSALGSV